MFTATKVQVVTYLLGVCLFSISFLVFLNSSVSFVITEIIGQSKKIGDAVGTLGFADELVAIVACPVWGALSDRIGLRTVSSLGYGIVGLSLLLFVQAKNVYPQLLLARMFFAIGGAATTTMVTAILPSMTATVTKEGTDHSTDQGQDASRLESSSVSSELTITPARSGPPGPSKSTPKNISPTRLAGFVGAFTGCGALIALGLFLPLPTRFKNLQISDAQALKDTFYVVGAVALAVGCFCFFGLRNLNGEETKGWQSLWISTKDRQSFTEGKQRILPYWSLVLQSFKAGFSDYRIGLGYLGGFVARASSVGISLFIPLFVNNYYISSGLCRVDSDDPNAIKSQCRDAYILAAQLTGVSQLVALICAPIFGFLADKYRQHQAPLVIASACGIVGYIAFASLDSPRVGGEDGSPFVFLIVSLLGISRIGAIVCSLGLVGRGVAGLEEPYASSSNPSSSSHTVMAGNGHTERLESDAEEDSQANDENRGLLTSHERPKHSSLEHIQGSIAGTYSLLGGAGILLLTKLGGYLFDSTSTASPFIMLAVFNAMLCIGGITCAFLAGTKPSK